MSTIFKLQPEPTFKADVFIPQPGGETAVLGVTFRHQTIKTLSAFEHQADKSAADLLAVIISEWALPEPCTLESMEVLLDNYPGAMQAIMKTYYEELTGNHEKNS